MSKADEQLYSISQLSDLTGLDRATVRKRLDGVEAKGGAKNAKTYSLDEALRALIAGERTEYDAAKLRKLRHEGDLKELELRRETGDVVEVKEVKEYTLGLFKRLHNRVAVRFPREIARQVHKAESPEQAAEILHRELGLIFNDVRGDHQRFL